MCVGVQISHMVPINTKGGWHDTTQQGYKSLLPTQTLLAAPSVGFPFSFRGMGGGGATVFLWCLAAVESLSKSFSVYLDFPFTCSLSF